ncbi:amidohydrolase [bacterium]|nr:amidohydrolase [bacterium]
MKKKAVPKTGGLFSVAVLCASLFVSCFRVGNKADLVLINGVIFTSVPDRSQVQALAVRGREIAAVGDNAEIRRFIGSRTRVLDLKGTFACPGFNDAHVHVLEGAVSCQGLDLKGVPSVGEIQNRIYSRAVSLQRHSPGSWIVGYGWDQNLFEERSWPDASDLDRIAPSLPIFLRRICGQAAVVNGMALQIAGIEPDTPNPPGGEIVKDPRTGIPTGILKGTAMDLVTQYIPQPPDSCLSAALDSFFSEAALYGITSIQDVSPPNAHHFYENLQAEEKLHCRISMGFPLRRDVEVYDEWRSRYRGDMLRFGPLYDILDGDIGSETAYFFQPYLSESSTRGLVHMTQNELNLVILSADRSGHQTAVHAGGDAASHMLLESYELADRLNDLRERRLRIDNLQAMLPQDMPRLRELGITAVINPVQCIGDMGWMQSALGDERCQRVHAWRTLNMLKVPLAIGSNWPRTPLNPLLGIYAAVTRRDSLGNPPQGWYAQERLSIADAIRAYTHGSAYAEFTEARKGTLEPGKLADIAVMDRNLLAIPPSEILRTHVLYTILSGRIVYSRHGRHE